MRLKNRTKRFVALVALSLIVFMYVANAVVMYADEKEAGSVQVGSNVEQPIGAAELLATYGK